MICKKFKKKKYVDGNVAWVPLCTDIQKQTICVDIWEGNRCFAMNILILFRWKKYMKRYSIIL